MPVSFSVFPGASPIKNTFGLQDPFPITLLIALLWSGHRVQAIASLATVSYPASTSFLTLSSKFPQFSISDVIALYLLQYFFLIAQPFFQVRWLNCSPIFLAFHVESQSCLLY